MTPVSRARCSCPRALALLSTRNLPPLGRHLKCVCVFYSVWARAILLTTPTVATVGCCLTIPIAFASDFLLHGEAPHALSVLGASVMVGGFYFVSDREGDGSGGGGAGGSGRCCSTSTLACAMWRRRRQRRRRIESTSSSSSHSSGSRCGMPLVLSLVVDGLHRLRTGKTSYSFRCGVLFRDGFCALEIKPLDSPD